MPEAFDPYLHWLGIRDPRRPPDHYRLLGVELFESDPEVLANAADRQMSHVRTFQTGRHSAESQQLLNELAAAKVCLLNAKLKAAYDAELRAKLPPREIAPPMPPPPPPPPPVESEETSGVFLETPMIVASPRRRSSRRRRDSTSIAVSLALLCVLVISFLTLIYILSHGG
jgi:hypothetical protein